MSAKLVIKICVFFINFTNRQFWAARQFHWHEIRRRQKALLRLSASDGQARAGPEGETSFPYEVNPVRKLSFKMR